MNALVVFVDETGVSLIPNARKTWAKQGRTPVLHHQFRWPKVSAISGSTPEGKLFSRVHEGSIRESEVIAFLKHLMQHNPRRHLVILWDGGPQHRSLKVRAFLHTNSERLTAHRLPAYAPELNPTELLFAHLKTQQLANHAPRNLQELRQGIRKATMRIRVRPHIIQNIVQGSQLPCTTLLT